MRIVLYRINKLRIVYKELQKILPFLGRNHGVTMGIGKILTTLHIPISEERLERLTAVAARQHIAPEELIQLTIDELISRPEQEIVDVMEYVLHKNAELYRRLS